MSIAIGGDETGALVGDVGSAVSKFGFGGEDAPKCVLDSALGCVGGGESRGLEIDADLPPLDASTYGVPDDYPASLHASAPWAGGAAREDAGPPTWFGGDVACHGARRLAAGRATPCSRRTRVTRRPSRASGTSSCSSRPSGARRPT